MWFVYLVQCIDGSYYCGITKDVQRRLLEHNIGKRSAKYTRSRRPVHLVAAIHVKSRSSACKIEYRVKQVHHAKKEVFLLQQLEDQR